MIRWGIFYKEDKIRMKIRGIELEFDITSPQDILRYKKAGEKMEKEGANVSWPELAATDPNYLEQYVESLNIQLKLYGDFMDEVFGEGIANQLLGSNPSLTKVTEIMDEMTNEFTKQGENFGVSLKKYSPNRRTKRGNK